MKYIKSLPVMKLKRNRHCERTCLPLADKRSNLYKIIIILILVSCISSLTYAQRVGQSMQQYFEEQREKKEQNKTADTEIKVPVFNAPELKALPDNKKEVYVAKVVVRKEKGIGRYIERNEKYALLKPYEFKMLTLDDMKEICTKLKQASRIKGLKFYVPLQDFAKGIMYVNCVEQ